MSRDLRRSRSGAGPRVVCGAVAIAALLPWGCAPRGTLLEVSGTVMYERPSITSVTHTLTDARAGGGAVTVRIEVHGDPGLAATFDINPGVTQRRPLTETRDGVYAGEFVFPKDVVGGPYTILVTLRHEKAGETVWRDPKLITIPLEDRI